MRTVPVGSSTFVTMPFIACWAIATELKIAIVPAVAIKSLLFFMIASHVRPMEKQSNRGSKVPFASSSNRRYCERAGTFKLCGALYGIAIGGFEVLRADNSIFSCCGVGTNWTAFLCRQRYRSYSAAV